MVIIASLRGFKMNFLFWTISFCRRQKGKERKKKKKKKKGKERKKVEKVQEKINGSK